MTTAWRLPDFDAHEVLHFVHDRSTGLKSIVAIHSTHLGPSAGGARFWHYAQDEDAITDALRLSRGMSYKNAMAGLPLGGGKSVILADEARTKTPELLAAFGRAVDVLGGRYITAEDVGMSVKDMVEVARQTKYVAGLPAEGGVGGDPGPHTSLGVFLGLKAAVRRALGKDDVSGLHVALHAAAEGAKLSIADIDPAKARKLADAAQGIVVAPEDILSLDADVLSPNALGGIFDESTIPTVRARVVAGGANNQLATPEDGARMHERGILYAPDYVINAGGIINVCTEYLGDGDEKLVRERIEGIPDRLEQIWAESETSGRDPAAVADAMAQRLIGRA